MRASMNRLNYGISAAFAIAVAGAAVFLLLTEESSTLSVVGSPHVHVAHANRRQPLVVDFVLKNGSHQPIVIDSISSGCSCVTSKIDGTTIPAGGSTTVSVSVQTFDAYAAQFTQQALVRWADESLTLTVSGTLPPSDKVLYRPTRLRMSPHDSHPSASVVVRIPKHCGGQAAITAADVRVAGLPGAEVAVESLDQGGLYRDYRIEISLSAATALQATNGELTIVTPCEEVLVPIVADS